MGLSLKLMLWVLLLFMVKSIICLKTCSVATNKPEICAIYENHTMNKPPRPWPMKLQPTIEFRDIIDFDQDANTITLVVRVLMHWNDTSIKLAGPMDE